MRLLVGLSFFTFNSKQIIPYVQLLQEGRVLPISLRSRSKRNKCQNTVLTFLKTFKGVDLHGGG